MLRTIVVIMFIFPSSGLYAGNLSEADAILFSRVHAYAYPDYARSACRSQSIEVKNTLEALLKSSGLTDIRESSICEDDVCLRAKGDERLKRDPNAIRKMIANYRKELVDRNMVTASVALDQICHQAISSLKKVKHANSKKPESILAEMFPHH